MCFATMALVAGVAGAATSAYGSIESGNAQASAANYQAAVAHNNSIVASQNANYTSAAGSEQATMTSMKSAATQGNVKATQAANNIDVNSGSAVSVQQGAREAGKLDALTVENNAILQAYGYKNQATNFDAQSELDKEEAKQDEEGGYLGALGGLLGSASSLGFKYAGMQGG